MPGATSTDGEDRLLAGRYRLVSPIASGGMAEVWEALDETLGRPVAVKILHRHLADDDAFVARFRAEAVSAARLSHPAIVSIYDTWSGDGVEAIVMELVRGTTLRHLVDHRGSLAVAEALTIADHVSAALEAAHSAGIVHRDIKPANVLLSIDGRVLVTDFGIAKASAGGEPTAERAMLGTARYLAPEQVEGAPVDGRADIYGLGTVLYEMLCGRTPFQGGSDAEVALARLQRSPDPPSSHRAEVPKEVDDLVMRCLGRRPEDRPADAATLRRALAEVRQGLGPERPVPLPPEPGDQPEPETEHKRRRSGRRLLLAGIGCVCVLGLALWTWGTGDGSGGAPSFATAAAFDPLGQPPDQENNNRAALAIDGDATTGWVTETYRDPEGMAGKEGVGLTLELRKASTLRALVVTGPSSNWSARIHLATGRPPADLAAWGPPVASATGLGPGQVTFDLRGREAGAVLVWITRTGDDGTVQVDEVRAVAA